MKIKSDINTNHFHDEYVSEYKRLHAREETSRRLYASIIRVLFDFIKEKLYEGCEFTTPIGQFKIVKVQLNTRLDRKLVSHAASMIEGRVVYRTLNKPYFHRLAFIPLPSLEERYLFKGLQLFVKKIYQYYD